MAHLGYSSGTSVPSSREAAGLRAHLFEELTDLLCVLSSVDVPQGSRLLSALREALNSQLIGITILDGFEHFCGEQTGGVTLKDLPSKHRRSPSPQDTRDFTLLLVSLALGDAHINHDIGCVRHVQVQVCGAIFPVLWCYQA